MPLVHIPHYVAGPGEYAMVWDRDGRERGQRTGGQRHCALEGCTGMRIGIRWPNGQLTWPCTKGLAQRPDGDWQLL